MGFGWTVAESWRRRAAKAGSPIASRGDPVPVEDWVEVVVVDGLVG